MAAHKVGNSPFTKSELEAARRMGAALADCQSQLDAAQAAGFNCGDACDRCQHLRQSFQQVLDAYHQDTST